MSQEKIKLGIDFGTKYCLVGTYNTQLEEIELYHEQIPSCIWFENGLSNGPIVMGVAATSDENVNKIVDIKKVIGRSKEDIEREDQDNWEYKIIEKEELLFIQLEDQKLGETKKIHVETIVSLMFGHIINSFLNTKGGREKFEIEEVVVPVPVEFDDRQRKVIEQALKVIGVNNVYFISEPTVALHAFQHEFKNDLSPEDGILVIDFGGGTLDFSFCKVDNKHTKPKHIAGDQNLGGLNFDTVMKKYIINQLNGNEYCYNLLKNQRGREAKGHRTRRMKIETKIIQEAEIAKIALSSKKYYTIEVNKFFKKDEILEYEIEDIIITREQYEEECEELYQRFEKLLDATIKKQKQRTITKVILIGGTCELPKVKQIVERKFDKEKIIKRDFNPLQAVCKGAILTANRQEHGIEKEPFDTIAQPLGLDVSGRIIRFANDGEELPISTRLLVTTQYDNQKSISLNIYRGPGEFAGPGTKFLTSFTINDIPSMKKEDTNIEVKIRVNRSGMIEVETTFLGTDFQKELATKLNLDEQIEKLETIREEYERYSDIFFNF